MVKKCPHDGKILDKTNNPNSNSNILSKIISGERSSTKIKIQNIHTDILNQDLDAMFLNKRLKEINIEKNRLKEEIHILLEMYSKVFSGNRINTKIFEEKDIAGIISKYNFEEKFHKISSNISRFYIDNNTKYDKDLDNDKNKKDEDLFLNRKDHKKYENKNFTHESIEETTINGIQSIDFTRKIHVAEKINKYELTLLDNCEKEKTSLITDNDAKEIKIMTLESKIKILEESNKKRTKIINEKQQELEKCLSIKEKEESIEIDSLKNELQMKITLIKEYQIEIDNFKKQISNKKNDLTLILKEKEESNIVIEKNKIVIKDCKIEKENFQKQIIEKDKILDKYKEEINYLKSEVEIHKLSIKTCTINLESEKKIVLTHNCDKQEIEIKKLKDELNLYISSKDKWKTKYKSKEHELEQCSNQVNELKVILNKRNSESEVFDSFNSHMNHEKNKFKYFNEKIRKTTIIKNNNQGSDISENEFSSHHSAEYYFRSSQEKIKQLTLIKEELDSNKENLIKEKKKYEKCVDNLEERRKELCNWKIKYDDLESSNQQLKLKNSKNEKLLEENQVNFKKMKDKFLYSNNEDDFKNKYEECNHEKNILSERLSNLEKSKKTIEMDLIIAYFNDLKPTDEVCKSFERFKNKYKEKCSEVNVIKKL